LRVRSILKKNFFSFFKCSLLVGIQRYVFYSIDKCDEHKEVPLMNMKYAVEEYLKASGMNYTVLRLCGFMQPLISGYAVPVLEVGFLYLSRLYFHTA
jgi:uncharacterized protein YbjT (DUF2867 family)